MCFQVNGSICHRAGSEQGSDPHLQQDEGVQQAGVVLLEPEERCLQRLRTPHDDAETSRQLRRRPSPGACSVLAVHERQVEAMPST